MPVVGASPASLSQSTACAKIYAALFGSSSSRQRKWLVASVTSAGMGGPASVPAFRGALACGRRPRHPRVGSSMSAAHSTEISKNDLSGKLPTGTELVVEVDVAVTGLPTFDQVVRSVEPFT